MEIEVSALVGMQVLDVTQVMAGAYCSMMLGDMGADVIKVEKPVGGDDTRNMGGAISSEESPAFMAVNRNKRGLAVDLREPRGAALLTAMAAKADVLVENYRPGTMKKLGLDYETLREVNPALIYCSISGFGATGPYASRGGFDLIAQGMSGLMSMTGEPDGPPVKVGVPICDLNAGTFAVQGILAAYIHRLRSGRGQFVDTSLYEAGIAATVWETAMWVSNGVVAERIGSAHRLIAPYEAFKTSDGYVNIGAANASLWAKACAILGMPELVHDERFADRGPRLANRAILAAFFERVLVTRTTSEWVDVFEEAGIPCGPLRDVSQVYDDPQAQAREMLIEIEHPRAGMTRSIGFPVKMSDTPGQLRRPAPLLGQHSREVLREIGRSDDEISHLIDEGIVLETLTTAAIR